jgi:predicted SAM-dependent methyltransferase
MSTPTPTPAHRSETSKHREFFEPFTLGYGLDVGFGGDALVPHAITFDMALPYTEVGTSIQHLGGDCRNIPFRKNTLDWIYSSHLIEDFTYDDLIPLLKDWVSIIKPVGGKLLLLAPDQKRFLVHCAHTGQPVNDAHKEPDFSLRTFKRKVLPFIASRYELRTLVEFDDLNEYSWGIVLERNKL